MSPRAAWRLESLGFEEVFDYVAGKQDWLAFGLPVEGALAAERTIGQVADRSVPTCSLTDSIAEVRQRMGDSSTCVVVNKENVVLGWIRHKPRESDSDTTVEELMEPGPSTFRPNVPVNELADYMRKQDVTETLVTTSDGKLVGLFRLQQ
ncbi:MAG TPA: CBS domain-containing protein [Candidatus Eisenbacteria bacterium]|nr:CBS domain-containing protein [Candidatus Eisenbacteria bacterium]